MKIQKFYKWYCVAVWSLWSLAIVLSCLSEGLFNGDKTLLSALAFFLWLPSFFMAVIPAQPILAIISLVFSIKNKMSKCIVFDILSILISAILVVGIFFIYILYWAPSH